LASGFWLLVFVRPVNSSFLLLNSFLPVRLPA
jgi:hypothetical protein